MQSQANASQNSRQIVDNIHNDFQPFACIMTEKFDNTQKINLTIILGKRIKKSVEKRQHKIKQINNWPVFKETVKVENNRVELKFSFTKLFCNRLATDSQVNVNLSMLKILKSIIFNISTKNIKIFRQKVFIYPRLIFLHTVSFFYAPLYLFQFICSFWSIFWGILILLGLFIFCFWFTTPSLLHPGKHTLDLASLTLDLAS